MAEKPQITRAQYLHFLPLPTRWMDNDIYGHSNNALYYAFFDTAINEYLIAEGGLDITAGTVVAFAAESQCEYLRPLAFPGVIEIGLSVGKLGNSSVRYELAIFKQGETFACMIFHLFNLGFCQCENPDLRVNSVCGCCNYDERSCSSQAIADV
jgi:acyl-CoA thioester hydrolase